MTARAVGRREAGVHVWSVVGLAVVLLVSWIDAAAAQEAEQAADNGYVSVGLVAAAALLFGWLGALAVAIHRARKSQSTSNTGGEASSPRRNE